jgi:hypothetical protein
MVPYPRLFPKTAAEASLTGREGDFGARPVNICRQRVHVGVEQLAQVVRV